MSYRAQEYVEPSLESSVGTVAELFAGVGGFRIGLAKSGWKTIFSNQWEPSTRIQHASSVYVSNFGDAGHSNEDFRELMKRHRPKNTIIPKTDMIVGGFPCQDYSVAKSKNSAHGLLGKKGVLWWEIRKLIELNRPKYVLLENVDRLIKSPTSQRGRDFAIILRTLGDLGYEIEWRVINAADYGMPQRRIRIFIIASKVTTAKALTARFAHERVLETGLLARALPVEQTDDELQSINLGGDVISLSDTFGVGRSVSPFRSAGIYRSGIAYTVKAEANSAGINRLCLKDVLESEESIPESFVIENSQVPYWEFLKGAKQIARVHRASGRRYTYAEGRMGFPDCIDKPSRTILTAEGGSTPSRFKHVIAHGDTYRRLMPIELERLSGFPDNWTAEGEGGLQMSDARRAFFIGNALVVGIVERIGQVLAEERVSGRLAS